MICKHLQPIEAEVLKLNLKETYRDKTWPDEVGEWVFYDCYIDTKSLLKRLKLDDCVSVHEHLGTHDGCENGFVCNIHKDGIMGVHLIHSENKKHIK